MESLLCAQFCILITLSCFMKPSNLCTHTGGCCVLIRGALFIIIHCRTFFIAVLKQKQWCNENWPQDSSFQSRISSSANPALHIAVLRGSERMRTRALQTRALQTRALQTRALQTRALQTTSSAVAAVANVAVQSADLRSSERMRLSPTVFARLPETRFAPF